MNPDLQRELIPRDATLRLIGEFDDMKAKLLDAFEQWQLLDETGHVPAMPSYVYLLQHVADAQALSRDVVRMTAEFARPAHSTNRAGTAVLAHLATAATLSSHAASYFAEAAETVLLLSRRSAPTDGTGLENHMVIDHATARAHLRRTSESLRHAVEELHDHLNLHLLFPTPSRRESPAPPPPRPSARRR